MIQHLKEFAHVFAYCVWYLTLRVLGTMLILSTAVDLLFDTQVLVRFYYALDFGVILVLFGAAILTRRYFRHIEKEAEERED